MKLFIRLLSVITDGQRVLNGCSLSRNYILIARYVLLQLIHQLQTGRLIAQKLCMQQKQCRIYTAKLNTSGVGDRGPSLNTQRQSSTATSDTIVTLSPGSLTRGDADGMMGYFYRSFNPVCPPAMERSQRCFFSAFPPSSIFIQQGYCFVITQQRRMTGDVIFTISLQFLHMKAIDFLPSRPQKKLRSPAAQPSIE